MITHRLGKQMPSVASCWDCRIFSAGDRTGGRLGGRASVCASVRTEPAQRGTLDIRRRIISESYWPRTD